MSSPGSLAGNRDPEREGVASATPRQGQNSGLRSWQSTAGPWDPAFCPRVLPVTQSLCPALSLLRKGLGLLAPGCWGCLSEGKQTGAGEKRGGHAAGPVTQALYPWERAGGCFPSVHTPPTPPCREHVPLHTHCCLIPSSQCFKNN